MCVYLKVDIAHAEAHLPALVNSQFTEIFMIEPTYIGEKNSKNVIMEMRERDTSGAEIRDGGEGFVRQWSGVRLAVLLALRLLLLAELQR